MGTVRQEVARIEENVANAYAAAAIKGAILPASETIANLASTINTIQSATDLNDSVCGYEPYLSKVTCGGGCVQNNIPTPSQPSNIICNNGEIRFNVRSNIPDNLEILDKLYFTGSQYSHGGVGEPYSNIIKTSLNLNDLTSATRATDWMNVKIEIDAKVYNQNETHDYPVGNRSNLLFMDGAKGLDSKTYGGSLAVCYSDNPSHQSQFFTYTYIDHAAYHSATNNEHRCLYTMNFSNSTVSVYDKEESDYLLNTSINISKTYGEIPEVTTTPLNVYIGGTITGAYVNAAKMYLYSVKVTRLTDNVVLYDGIPAMDYNTGKCGLFDSVSGNFDVESDGTASLIAGDVINPIYNTIGTREQIQDVVNNTSSVLNLLALDSTVIDTQKLKEGIINRQVGIKVLNGTETWGYTNQGTYGNSTFASTDAIIDRDYTKRFAYCTHFQNTESTSDLTTNGKMFLGVSSQKINFCNTSFTTPTDFASWLSTQYNAGTPVIILYPLTNDVDIKVPAQNQLQHTPLTQITGSISNLPIDSYKVIQKRTIDVTGKFTNIEHIDKNSFFNLFQYGYSSGITFIWDDNVSQFRQKTYGDLEFTNLKSMSLNASMNGAFAYTAITSASFPALTDFEGSVAAYGETTTGAPFQNAFNNANSLVSLSFGALQTIPSGNDYLFYKITSNCYSLTTISYPLLEAILCQRAFGYAFNGAGVVSVTFPSLKFIDGYYTFDNAFANCPYLQTVSFPSLGIPYLAPGFPQPQISIGTYTFQNAFSGCTALTEIHFRADVQSRIEAQAGYSTKWGATNATIYFDL